MGWIIIVSFELIDLMADSFFAQKNRAEPGMSKAEAKAAADKAAAAAATSL